MSLHWKHGIKDVTEIDKQFDQLLPVMKCLKVAMAAPCNQLFSMKIPKNDLPFSKLLPHTSW